jgi:uncharacterized protein YhaN
MRIATLELIAYGLFHGTTLDFSAPGVHVVFGRNEAGKSTTLRAITALLYGIEPKTRDGHLHDPRDLRIGGVIESASGERLRIVRRKGNVNTLLDERDKPIDEGVMRRLLGGVSKETFTLAFGLDHGTLEAGANALLEGKGDLGESLFDAGVGGGGEVQRLLAQLEAEADAIYRPRASSLPLNEALKSFAEAQRVIREKESRPEAFIEQERGLLEAVTERAAQVAKKKELETKRARIARARRRVPLERRRDRARQRLAELGPIAAQLERVEALKDRFSLYEKTLDQRREHRSKAERLAESVASAARRAGVDPGADMGTLRLDGRRTARVETLLGERTALLARLEAAATEIARLERERERLSEIAGRTEQTRDAAGERRAHALASALDSARALGDIESRIATERTKLDLQRRKLGARAAALGPFEGRLDELVVLRLPALATVRWLQARAHENEVALSRVDERLADLEREAASIEKELAVRSGDFAPPDLAALRAARSARDEAWRALRAARDENARRAAEVEVEGLLREADAVADRMIAEADRVTALARLRSESEAVARQIEKARDDQTRAVRARDELYAELAALFEPAGVKPKSFAEACQWLEDHAQIAEALAALREAEAALAAEEAKATSAKEDLGAALRAADEGIGDVPVRLADLVALAAERAARIESRRREAADAARALVEIRTKLDERIALRTRDEAALADVSGKLGELLEPLGIPADAHVDEVRRSIEALRELFDLVDARAEEEARMRVAEAEIRAFEDDLSRALADLAPDLAPMEPRGAARALFARAAEAREVAKEASTLDVQLASEERLVLDDAERALLSDPDAAARAEEELGEQLDEVDAEISRLTERIGGLRSGLEKMRAESHAAEAAAAAQLQLSRVRENVERWCRVRLAAVVLSREIERYREENQGPLLAASSALFSRLTLNAFAGIKAGFDEKDRPCLRCVRADGTEVDVSGLSDGTRDQLYLSLRLASLLRRAEVAEPMPLVLDDVLIQLDDQRAAAALSVLAEVARTMQVLFFTHHARLVELARVAIPSSELVVHELTNARTSDPAVALAPGQGGAPAASSITGPCTPRP